MESTTNAPSAGLSGALGAMHVAFVTLCRRSRKRSRRLAEKPFSINCLCRRSARDSALAVRNTLSTASGKTTVPMSRPSATSPGARRSRAAGRAAPRAAPDRRRSGRPRRRPTRRGSRRSRPRPPTRMRPPRSAPASAVRQRRQRRLVSRGRRRRAAPPARQPVQRHRNRGSASRARRHALGDRALAGRGRPVDRDQRHRRSAARSPLLRALRCAVPARARQRWRSPGTRSRRWRCRGSDQLAARAQRRHREGHRDAVVGVRVDFAGTRTRRIRPRDPRSPCRRASASLRRRARAARRPSRRSGRTP